MKTTIAAFACVVCAAGCGSSNPPAQAPMSTTAENPPPATSPVPNGATYGSTSTYGTTTPPAATAQTTTPEPTGTGATSMMGQGTTGAGTPSTPGTTGSTTPSTTGAAGTTGMPDTSNPSADNTRMNTRDRQATLTPLQQGNSKAEMGITAAIRRGVMRDSSLSITAKNVKIITVGTTVTLRGPVKSEAERSAIESLARQTAGVTDVDDQLEVKGTK